MTAKRAVRKSKTIFLLAAALATIIVFFFLFRPASSAIEVIYPRRGPAVQAVYATGTVEPEIMLPISPRFAARITALKVDEGDEIKKGALLTSLESSDLESALAGLRAKEQYAKTEYLRQDTLIKKGAGTKQAFERARSDWDAAKAAISQAEAEKGFMDLISPVDGRIIRRDGEVGQLIPVNQPIFWIAADLPLRISAEVDEEDIAQVTPGQEVAVRADAFPEEVFEGKVTSVTPKGDPIARSYRVRIELNQATPLKIGMTAETNIVVADHENAILIPRSSLFDEQVWLVREGKLLQQPVKIGARGEDDVEVISGIKMEDKIVVMPQADFKNGWKVKAVLVDQES